MSVGLWRFFWVAQNKFLDCWPKINTPKGNYCIYCIVTPQKVIDKQNTRRKSKNKSWSLVFGKLLMKSSLTNKRRKLNNQTDTPLVDQ